MRIAGRPRKSASDKLRDAIQAASRAGTPQVRIAEDAGVRPSSVSRFVNGKMDLHMETARKVARALGYDLDLVKRKPKRKK